ncbi:MAG: hypothetical protein V1740_04965 [Candidatus Woesearchaeota archaeon]
MLIPGGIIKRLTSNSSSSTHKYQEDFVEHPTRIPKELINPVKDLTEAIHPDQETARKAVEEILAYSRSHNRYITAYSLFYHSGIRFHEGNNRRICTIAGDIFLEDLLSQLFAFGPSTLAQNLREIMACYAEGDHIRRALKSSIDVIDNIAGGILDSFTRNDKDDCGPIFDKRKDYFRMISLVFDETNELFKSRIEEQRKSRVAHRKTNPPTDPAKKRTTPVPVRIIPDNPFSLLDQQAVSYFDDLKNRVNCSLQPLSQVQQRPSGDHNSLGRFYQGLYKRMQGDVYQVVNAMILERLAPLYPEAYADARDQQLQKAAQHYENQGDIETTLLIVNLAGARYQHASEIHAQIGDRKSQARLLMKRAYSITKQGYRFIEAQEDIQQAIDLVAQSNSGTADTAQAAPVNDKPYLSFLESKPNLAAHLRIYREAIRIRALG